MILQALARYYDILANDPECPIARRGYSTTNVSFALALAADGTLKGLLPLVQSQMNGKKLVEVARRMVVPEQVKRSGTSPNPNFLCDNPTYVLGISEKDEANPGFGARRFAAFRDLHHTLLAGCDCPEARAVLAFLDQHDPLHAREHPLIQDNLEALAKGGNLVFMLAESNIFAHEAPEIRRVWEAHKAASEGEFGQCLATGEWTKIARLHPNLKGVRDAQASGATLVGFNAPAYESYNREKQQGWNAPTGEQTVFAYTTVLNFLLSRQSHNPKFQIGDATVVYWAESASPLYAGVFSAIFDPDALAGAEETLSRDQEAEQRLREIASKVKAGAPVDENSLLAGLNRDTPFYVLGLAPNAARIAVRFFNREPFGRLVRRILAHYEDAQIESDAHGPYAGISPHRILEQTISRKADKAVASPLMAGALMKAILNDTTYPAALFYAIINRVRADQDDPKQHFYKINPVRAAVVKAYLTRKYRNQPHSPIQEVLCMALNEQSTNPAYLLGRLFAVLEKAQAEAIGNVNASIKDRYFTTACASPATVFPILLRLSQHHISKAEFGYALDHRIQTILDLLQMDRNPIPRHLSLDEQGIFILGYYHQRASFFRRREADAETSLTTTIETTF